MRRSLLIAALCAAVAIVGACTSGDEEAGISSPTLSAGTETPTPEAFGGFSDEEAAVVKDYLDAWNAHDVNAVMALFSEDAFTDPDEPTAAEELRCAHEVAFAAGVYVHIDFDTCVGQYVDADGQDVATAGSESEVCGGYCDWTFLFAEDGRLSGVTVPYRLEAVDGYSVIGDAQDKCLAEAIQE